MDKFDVLKPKIIKIIQGNTLNIKLEDKKAKIYHYQCLDDFCCISSYFYTRNIKDYPTVDNFNPHCFEEMMNLIGGDWDDLMKFEYYVINVAYEVDSTLEYKFRVGELWCYWD